MTLPLYDNISSRDLISKTRSGAVINCETYMIDISGTNGIIRSTAKSGIVFPDKTETFPRMKYPVQNAPVSTIPRKNFNFHSKLKQDLIEGLFIFF